MNDSVGRITLAGTEFNIRFTYNAEYNYWSFGIYDVHMGPIMPMTKIVPNIDLYTYYVYTDLPKGIFACWSALDRIGRDDFNNGKAKFGFITYDEIIAAGEEMGLAESS